jgi:hypothetical protein
MSDIQSNSSKSYQVTDNTKVDPQTHVVIGTIIRDFIFKQEPWWIVARDGRRLCQMSNIIFTLSKVFNPNNTTDSFAVISWDPNYLYRIQYPDDQLSPAVTLRLADKNGAILVNTKIGTLNTPCTIKDRQTLPTPNALTVKVDYFESIEQAEVEIAGGTWVAC